MRDSRRKLFKSSAAFLIVIVFNACQGRDREHVPAPIRYAPTATVRELMHSIIDPAADVVWLSVWTRIDAEGTQEIRPRTDEEWAIARRGAITLMESANLLMIPGRPVAHPGERSIAPGVELEPDQIADLIAEDPDAWNARSLVLHEVLTSVVDAIDARDADEVFRLGEQIEAVCESCHRQYWYPGETRPAFPADAPIRRRSSDDGGRSMEGG